MPQVSEQKILDWCVDYIAKLMNIPKAQVDVHADFDRFGLDSSLAVAMVMDLEQLVGRELAPSLLFECPNIAEVAARVSAEGGRT